MRLFALFVLLAAAAGVALSQAQGQVRLKQTGGELVLTNMPRPELARLSTFRTKHKEEYRKMAGEAAQRHGLDFNLLDAVIEAESRYHPRAVSPKGAQGLMQIMPKTGWELGLQDAFDPAQNIEAGARYLKAMLDRFGSTELALAAYNAGPKAVEKHQGIPPYRETQNYVRSIMAKSGVSNNLGGYSGQAAPSGGKTANLASDSTAGKPLAPSRKAGKVKAKKTSDGKMLLHN